MTQRTSQREAGFVSVEWMAAVAFSFIFLAMMLNLVVIQFGRGVMRSAADEGARSGARIISDPIAACESRSNEIIGRLGTMANDIENRCVIVDGRIRAESRAKFAGWLPGMPDFNITTSAVAVAESELVPE